MALWLHKRGYTFFDIPRLTYPEIKMLTNAKNRQVKKQEQESKKAQRKAKAGRRK